MRLGDGGGPDPLSNAGNTWYFKLDGIDSASTSGMTLQEVKALVDPIQPEQVVAAGAAYQRASGKLAELASNLISHAQKLAGAWGGETAPKAISQMRQLHDTAIDLANTSQGTASVLNWYGGTIQPWYKSQIQDMTDTLGDKVHGLLTGTDPANTAAANQLAKLNVRTVEAYDSIPLAASKNLPPLTGSYGVAGSGGGVGSGSGGGPVSRGGFSAGGYGSPVSVSHGSGAGSGGASGSGRADGHDATKSSSGSGGGAGGVGTPVIGGGHGSPAVNGGRGTLAGFSPTPGGAPVGPGAGGPAAGGPGIGGPGGPVVGGPGAAGGGAPILTGPVIGGPQSGGPVGDPVPGEPIPRDPGVGGPGMGGPGGEPVFGEPVISGRTIGLMDGGPASGESIAGPEIGLLHDPIGGESGSSGIGVLGGENAATEGQAYADGAGLGPGQAGDAAAVEGLAAGDASGAEAMAGPGFMPVGGGARGSAEREHTTWLAEDTDVWGDDGEMTPAVIN